MFNRSCSNQLLYNLSWKLDTQNLLYCEEKLCVCVGQQNQRIRAMAVEKICLIPRYFSWVSSSGTSSLSPWQHCGTFHLRKIKSMLFSQQVEFKSNQNRVRDCFSHS